MTTRASGGRDARKADLVPDVEIVVGDLTRPETLQAAVDGVGAIVFTHRSDGGGKAAAERIDYGVIARRQLAEVLVASLTSDHALRKSFELVATQGLAQSDLESLFAGLDADPPDAQEVRELTACHG